MVQNDLIALTTVYKHDKKKPHTGHYSFRLLLFYLPIINKRLHSTVTPAQPDSTWWAVGVCFAVGCLFFLRKKKRAKILLVDSQQRLLNYFVPVLPSAFYWAVWRHSTLSISVKVVTAAPLSDEHKHHKKKKKDCKDLGGTITWIGRSGIKVWSVNTTGRSMIGLQEGNRQRDESGHRPSVLLAQRVWSTWLLHDASATAAAGVHRWFYLSSDMCLIASAVHSCWVNCNEPPLKKAVVYLWLVISGVDNQGATESVQTN